MHTSFYILLHFVLSYYYIIEQRFWGAYIVLASAIVQSSVNQYVYTKIIQIWQNGRQIFSNLAGWCHILSSTYLKCGT